MHCAYVAGCRLIDARRAAERYYDISPEERIRRRERGWGDQDTVRHLTDSFMYRRKTILAYRGYTASILSNTTRPIYKPHTPALLQAPHPDKRSTSCLRLPPHTIAPLTPSPPHPISPPNASKSEPFRLAFPTTYDVTHSLSSPIAFRSTLTDRA